MQPVGEHTLYELQIVSEKHCESTILKYFDKTISYGGRDLLKTMIRTPKNSLVETVSAQQLLKTISSNRSLWQVDVSHAYVAAAESYYSSNIAHTMSQDVFQHWFQTMVFAYRNPAEYSHIESGLAETFKVLGALKEMISRCQDNAPVGELEEDFAFVKSFLDAAVLKVHASRGSIDPSKGATFYLDYYLRKQKKESFRRILDIYYKLDALTAIAKACAEYGLCYPEFVTEDSCFEMSNSWHPLVEGCVRNHFSIRGNSGICLLTGANTSGKTTFLKTCGIVLYLAHLGGPVPAESVRLSFLDRFFTSIHLSDDINLGYSHFYNEVMRVQEMAQALRSRQKCVIIIDELFRGTNQQDALHCSQTVLNGFANFKDSMFMVSTHLLELLDHYTDSSNVFFHCFRTKIVGNDFENTFLMEPGIASEKVGKLIMEKAGIPALLNLEKRPPFS
ncbi:MutS-related protein [Dyadobacter sp. 32]|uniref:MutS-related protein n=1 Tax=Dyadobacter sp. 32 TaxID=538966 RepID=UPI0011F08612